jgi:hypothetical protein
MSYAHFVAEPQRSEFEMHPNDTAWKPPASEAPKKASFSMLGTLTK